MEFTTNEIEHMREQLACNAFKALTRRIPGQRAEVYTSIAEHLNVSKGLVANFGAKSASKKHAEKLSEFALSHGIRLYAYQFYPTTKICLAWLEHDYRCDRGKHPSKHIFHHWDRDMGSLKVTAQEAA